MSIWREFNDVVITLYNSISFAKILKESTQLILIDFKFPEFKKLTNFSNQIFLISYIKFFINL